MATSQDAFEQVDTDDFADLFQNIEDLKRLSLDTADYFEGSPKEKAERGVEVFQQITAALAGVELLCNEIAPHVSDYDFSKETKGNGFRSLLTVTNRCLTKLVRLSQRCYKKRDRVIFTSPAFDDIVAYTEVLKCLSRLLLSATAVLEGCSPETSVFPDEDALDKKFGWDVESFPRVPFYGKCLGFQVGVVGFC
jgi:hormone-sensitive lipase